MKWEYKTVQIKAYPSDSDFAEFQRTEWELVSAVFNVNYQRTTLIFKRQYLADRSSDWTSAEDGRW